MMLVFMVQSSMPFKTVYLARSYHADEIFAATDEFIRFCLLFFIPVLLFIVVYLSQIFEIK